MTKFYAQRKDVFDIDKITVVGNPTITSDGVASGFSGSNYITGISIDYSSLNNYEFHIKINSGDTPSDNSMFWGIQRALYLYQNSNGKILFTDASSGASLSFVADRNTDYEIICGHNENNLYYLKYKKIEEENYTILSATVNQRTTANGVLIIGCFSGGGFPLLTGSIELGSIKVYANNQLVYSPTKPTYLLERRKEGYDPSKFTVVGSPTITEDGVLDGLTTSTTNYLTIPYDITGANSVKVEFEATSQFLPETVERCEGALFGSKDVPFYVYTSNNSSTVGIDTWFCDSTGTAILRKSYNLTPTGSLVKFAWELKDNIWSMHITTSAGWDFKNTIPADEIGDITSSGVIKILAGKNGWNVNLPSISITVDGVEVFTGAKEKFYVMRGGK